jgi:hypothetical protein
MGTTNHPIVGRVSYGVGKGGRLILPDGWERANIGTVQIPQLKDVPTYGGKFSGNVRFYKRAIPQLKAAFEAVEAAGLKDKILFWDGSFVPRLKRGGSTPSNHSFGTAFDVNADWNPFRRKPAAVGSKGDLHAVADAFKKFGFTWGGDWRNTPDGMHFEINRILTDLPETTRGDQAFYTLYFGKEKADELPVFDGAAYVAAWKWAAWFHLPLGWNPVTHRVMFGERELPSEIRMIGERAFIPIRAAVAFLGLRLLLDDVKREITVMK